MRRISLLEVIESTRLVELVMERLEAEGPSDLARKLGLHGPHSDQRVARWINGIAKPNYDATMQMLELIGAINQAALQTDPAEPAAERAEALLAKVDEARSAGGRGRSQPRGTPRSGREQRQSKTDRA